MLIDEFLSRLPAFACAVGLTSATVLMSTNSAEAQTMKPTILLVHGAWADSSSWTGVVDLLLKDGYTFERCRTRFAALRRMPPSSQRTSKPFLDRWFSSGTHMGAPSSASHPGMRRT